jgi:LysR family transcriptional regulator, glycine cleavage system transcriptional activator
VGPAVSANANNSAPAQVRSSPDVARHRLPPLKALLAFSTASRHGSFSQAAEELGVTPSAISHHIQQLEAFLSVRLFQRRAGRAVLTSAGRAYAKEVENGFETIANATDLLAPHFQRGHLVVASSPSFAAKWLQPRLPGFLRAHPDIKLRLSTLSDRDDLETNPFDVAIVYGVRPETRKHVEPLLTERLRPLCSPALAIAAGLSRPADLARVTLIHSVNALTWADYLRQIGEGALRPEKEIWLDRSAMALDTAVTGLGVVLESDLLASEELRAGKLVAPFGDFDFSVETTAYYFVRSTSRRNNAQISLFEDWLQAELRMSRPGI